VQPASTAGADFPGDVFHALGCLEPLRAEAVAQLRARLTTGKRLAVHGVRRVDSTGALGAIEALAAHSMLADETASQARLPQFFGIYLTDDQGNEQPLLDFHDATSATYAALRIAQRYRLSVEFGKFTEPKLRAPGDT
jgi:hypothetical protein